MRYQDESHQVRNNTRFLYNPYYDLTVLKEVGKEIWQERERRYENQKEEKVSFFS